MSLYLSTVCQYREGEGYIGVDSKTTVETPFARGP